MLFFIFVLPHLGSKNSTRKRHLDESGVTNAGDDVSGENSKFYPEELQGLLYNDLGFKRRERDDVKKPGPRLDANVLKLLVHNVTG